MLYDKDFDLVNSLNRGVEFLKPPSQVREYLPCSTANNEFPLRGNFEGRRGRETRLFAKRKCRALLVNKQSYGCFEMVLFPAKTATL